MHPVLFEIGGMRIPTYGTLLAIAFVSAIFVFAYLMTRTGVPFGKMVDFGFAIAISGEVGARLTYLIVEFDRFAAGTIDWKHFLVAGRVVLGGVAAAFIASFYWVRKVKREHGTTHAQLADAGFTGTSLGMAIGRLGCFMNGCCHGTPTDWSWGVVFTDPHAHEFAGTPLHTALHPTQLLQTLTGLTVLAVCWWATTRSRYSGIATGLFWVIVGTSRFFMEYLRGDDRGEWLFGFTTSQWISLVGVGIGLAWLYYAQNRLRLPSPWTNDAARARLRHAS
ncbi:hypothetical protein ABI59_00165 [Acidobacteria bacterium Mor1]|nr:hypothetical protein ABI59_00165 [Acidobacteria bacterium Mor1]